MVEVNMVDNLLNVIKGSVFAEGQKDTALSIDDSYRNGIIKKVKSVLETGDIIIAEPDHYSNFRLKDWVARGSRVVQNTRWGHTGLYDGCDNILEARVDVLFGRGKKYDGLTTRSLGEYIKEQNFLVARPLVDMEIKKYAVEKMKELLDKRYIKYDKMRFIEGGLDLMGLRSMKARDCEEESRIICSEAVAKAYFEWLRFANGRHYSQILPTHILNSSMVKHICIVDRDETGRIVIRRINK
jgi:hypothetical protein